MRLLRLREEGRRLVTPELASGEVVRHEERSWAPLVEEPERAIDLDELDGGLDALMKKWPPYEPAMDVEAAPAVHRALRLSRREASDESIWRFLTVVHRPDFLRHRWANTSWATMRTRFWSIGTRPDTNAFYRLWWIAEMTRDGESYALTERVLERPALTTKLFVRTLSFYRPAIQAASDIPPDRPAEDIERALVRLAAALGIVPLEASDRDRLRSLLGF